MHCKSVKILLILFCSMGLCNGNFGDRDGQKVLKVGEELWNETLPLQSGSCLYRLQGIKSHKWYEVKVSYPASTPSRFSIQLKRGSSELRLNQNRRLLNTEKLIFKSQSFDMTGDEGRIYVLVTVEPEGIVAMPHAQERQFVIFNIVCDELLMGIPYKGWWVAVLAVLCLGLALLLPAFLPPYLLRKQPKSSRRHGLVCN